MVILVWEVFRWLMSHLTLLVVPQFNQQMVEQAELMVKLALKDRGKIYVGKKVIPRQRKLYTDEKMNLGKKKHFREKIIDWKKEEKPKRGMLIAPMTKGKEEETVGDGVKQGDLGRHTGKRNQQQGDRRVRKVPALLQPNRKNREGSPRDR